mmetsp:Transcript_7866/g.15364  ORF Transcript_7866/g.15364 Transcript_7866/m.15364 type:complete len:232 (-) Transcript_7866:307-1002(-)
MLKVTKALSDSSCSLTLISATLTSSIPGKVISSFASNLATPPLQSATVVATTNFGKFVEGVSLSSARACIFVPSAHFNPEVSVTSSMIFLHKVHSFKAGLRPWRRDVVRTKSSGLSFDIPAISFISLSCFRCSRARSTGDGPSCLVLSSSFQYLTENLRMSLDSSARAIVSDKAICHFEAIVLLLARNWNLRLCSPCRTRSNRHSRSSFAMSTVAIIDIGTAPSVFAQEGS